MRIALAAIAATMLWGGAAAAADETITMPNTPPVRVHGPLPVARDLLATEMAFEARSVAAGPAVAMREYMDETDGLSFNGGEPARGAEAIFKAQGGKGPGGSLSWVPSEVFVDRDAEMGASWGRFRFTPPVPNAAVVSGKYVTVWRKDRSGHWKGILDIGNPD